MESNKLNGDRLKYINGRFRRVKASERRIERRREVYAIIENRSRSWPQKVDLVIDYFHALYEGTRYKGMTRDERRRIFIEKGGTCMWCGEPLQIGAFTIEHVIPLVEGGADDESNFGIAHEQCNNGRDGEVITAHGYFVDALRKYNPTVRFLEENVYPQGRE